MQSVDFLPRKRSRLRPRLLRHHLPVFVLSVVSVAALYFTRPYPDVISRASFATAYPALALLAATLLVGPWNVLRRTANPVSSDLRRDMGIWAGILGVVHAGVGQCVHLRGRPWLYYVYGPAEHHHGMRHDLFGLANYTVHSFAFQGVETQKIQWVITAAACVGSAVVLQIAGIVRRLS
jgi:methionine sulfoxide reductase heme-binding subunit